MDYFKKRKEASMAKKKVAKKKVAKKPAKKKVAKKKVAKKKVAKKPAKKKVAKKKVAKKKVVKKKVAKKKVAKKKRKPSAAFMKPMKISDALAKVIGSKPIPRTEVTKKLWAYIKKNKLQDRVNRRNINADDNLRVVFGGKRQVSMFEMTKLVSKHLS
jgi:chromatin remodeling complex protein RSC6